MNYIQNLLRFAIIAILAIFAFGSPSEGQTRSSPFSRPSPDNRPSVFLPISV